MAWAKREVSYGSRTNARTTRMPVICSRSTRLTVSMRVCISRNSGRILRMISVIEMASTGTATATSQDRPMSSRSAMITPPTMVMGAVMNIVHDNSTSIWTCCTSLVFRVIRVGAPNRLSSRAENDSTRSKMAPRTSRPKPMAILAPR